MEPTTPLILACGALARDLRSVLFACGFAETVTVEYLPASLHNRPERIVGELEPALTAAHLAGRPVFVAYADCGTSGALDRLLANYPGVTRLPGAHCYELFAGSALFAELSEAEPGTFYLTDYLARHFDALVWGGLGLRKHPELRDMYFGNYRRVVFISQTDDPVVRGLAVAAAAQLGLQFEEKFVGRHELQQAVQNAVSGSKASAA